MAVRRKAPVVLATVLTLAIAGTALASVRGTTLKMGLSNVLTGNYITSFAATVLNAPAFIIRNNSTTAASSALRVWAPYGGVPLEIYGKTTAAPMRVNSTVKVTNLNADRLDNLDSSAFARSIGSVVETQVVTGSSPSSTNSTTFADVAGATTTVTVPAGQEARLLIRFSAESACSGGTGWCSVQILVDATGAAPNVGADFAFDSTDAGAESSASWESHAMERTIVVPAGVHVVKVQALVTNAAITLRLDDWTLVVERIRTL
jgi:hypothetical protein